MNIPFEFEEETSTPACPKCKDTGEVKYHDKKYGPNCVKSCDCAAGDERRFWTKMRKTWKI